MTDSPQDDIEQQLAKLRLRTAELEHQVASMRQRQYLPMPPFPVETPETPFMSYSTCNVTDFLHPRHKEICDLLKHPFIWHRKLWEWVFVIHHLTESGLVKPDSRGLVFGVGHERLPALFASMGAHIVATDASAEQAEKTGWTNTNEHASNLEALRCPELVEGDVFDRNVTYRVCDMNNIAPDLVDFDFNWSSCCFEHLGSLEAGLQFVVNAVEKTLRPGGIAVHTTEYNLLSNDQTVESVDTVIYRNRDLVALVQRLRDRGHIVQPFVVAPNSHYWDFHIDVPPYTQNPHLKLLLWSHVATSAGIVVRRGR